MIGLTLNCISNLTCWLSTTLLKDSLPPFLGETKINLLTSVHHPLAQLNGLYNPVNRFVPCSTIEKPNLSNSTCTASTRPSAVLRSLILLTFSTPHGIRLNNPLTISPNTPREIMTSMRVKPGQSSFRNDLVIIKVLKLHHYNSSKRLKLDASYISLINKFGLNAPPAPGVSDPLAKASLGIDG